MTLEILTTDSLAPLRHGFFTRKGGASSGVFAGLNCGHGSSDQSEIVKINRTRVAEAMGVAPDCLLGVHQVHSADVVTATGATEDKPRADALVTNTPGLALIDPDRRLPAGFCLPTRMRVLLAQRTRAGAGRLTAFCRRPWTPWSISAQLRTI